MYKCSVNYTINKYIITSNIMRRMHRPNCARHVKAMVQLNHGWYDSVRQHLVTFQLCCVKQ